MKWDQISERQTRAAVSFFGESTNLLLLRSMVMRRTPRRNSVRFAQNSALPTFASLDPSVHEVVFRGARAKVRTTSLTVLYVKATLLRKQRRSTATLSKFVSHLPALFQRRSNENAKNDAFFSCFDQNFISAFPNFLERKWRLLRFKNVVTLIQLKVLNKTPYLFRVDSSDLKNHQKG